MVQTNNNQTGLILILIIAVVILSIALWQGCNKTPASVDNKKADSVFNAIKNISNKYVDSIHSLNIALHDKTVEQDRQTNVLTDTISAIRSRIRGLQKVIKVDTIGLIDPVCESLSDNLNQYVVVTDEKLRMRDSIIIDQAGIIHNDSMIIVSRENFISEFRAGIGIVSDLYSNLYYGYKQDEKKIRWFKTKEKAYWIVIGVLAGGLIMKK